METRLQHSSPSASRSSTERRRARAPALALAAGLALVAACGGDDDDTGDAGDAGGADAGSDAGVCGPGDAPADGITLAAGDADASGFGQLRSSANNDCTPPGGAGPTSLSIQGVQTSPSGASGFITLCLPRPDLIDAAAIPLDDADRVLLIDLTANASDGCDLDIDRERALAGDITFSGFCGDGTGADGYALSLAATVPLLRMCGEDAPEPIDGELGGSAAVASDSP